MVTPDNAGENILPITYRSLQGGIQRIRPQALERVPVLRRFSALPTSSKIRDVKAQGTLKASSTFHNVLCNVFLLSLRDHILDFPSGPIGRPRHLGCTLGSTRSRAHGVSIT